MLQIKNTKKYGRGIYASRSIGEGELIEASPVILLDNWEANRITPTILNCYVFDWDDDATAVAFGLGSLFNHCVEANVTYKANFETKTIDFVTLRDIKKGEQLFINYGYSVKAGINTTDKNRKKALERERRNEILNKS